jgi:hypothetical protein
VAQVELAFVVEKGAFDVGLHDVSSIAAIRVPISLFEDGFDFLQVEAHLDPVASVAILPRLHDPTVRLLLAAGLVQVALVYFLVALVVVLQELIELFVLETLLDVEGEGQVVEDLLSCLLVVVGHGVEEGLLVADHVVVYQVVLHLQLTDFSRTHCPPELEHLRTAEQAFVVVLLPVLMHVSIVAERLEVDIRQN